ncbi:MAG TPA: hypothetical protein VMD03_10425 [Steroidobacteraceae bacterium]|nr:hypothetical protein [Steroidobacteraceae bacterium]
MPDPSPPDDLEAVRVIVEVLKKFPPDEQARIVRWSQEKLGHHPTTLPTAADRAEPARQSGTGDIRSFIHSKAPNNDVQFAATVAYYYAFEAQGADRRQEISAADLQEATRLANTERLDRPITTLHNAVQRGYLDKGTARGTFKINTVGENLVAMSLPTTNAAAPARKSRPARKNK